MGTGDKIIQAQGGPVESPEYQLQSVELGPVKLGPIAARMEAHDPSYQARKVGQAGFLGTGLLKAYNVRIDYRHKRLQLLGPSDFSAANRHRCQGASVDFEPEWRGEAVTRVTTDIGEVVLWWDTGSVTALSRQYLDRAHPEITGGLLRSRRFVMGGHDYGRRTLEIWDANLPRGFQEFVGRDFLRDHVVCVDYPSKRVLIEQ